MLQILILWFLWNLVANILWYYSWILSTVNIKTITLFLIKFMPLIILLEVIFIYYYNIWLKKLSYWTLTIVSVAFLTVISLLIQYFIFHDIISLKQLLGIIIIIGWIWLIVF